MRSDPGLFAEIFYLVRDFRYPKAARLRKRSEFIQTSTLGKKIQNKHFIVYALANQKQTSRLGVTVTKRVGKAVERNRIKRYVREYFRVKVKRLEDHLDMNVIAKKESANLTSEEIFSSLENLFDILMRDRRC